VTKVRPAEIRFYLDADVLGLARVLVQVRSDVTFPGDPGGVVYKRERPPCPVTTPAVRDEEWIPVVSRQGWLIITRDRRIQDRPAEVSAVRDHDARRVALSSIEARSTFQQLEIVMSRWRDIENSLTRPGPFIYAATRSQLREIPLT
jgi:uncharacterized protein with PIN domain